MIPMRRSLLVLALTLALPAAVPAAEPPARNTEADRAVERALEFLHNVQDKNDGGWRAGRGGKNPAITSLAVMAFLSAGHVPGEGKYGETVEKGVRWVLARQQPNGLIASEYGHEMYHHGIATLMLAEVAGMTDGELGKEVRKKLEKAVALILKAQRRSGGERGGWRYQVAHVNGSDMSVTGWQLMALRAAKNLGCDVPAEVIDRAVDYVKRSHDRGRGGFCYTPGGNLTVACTGTGVLALELCGKDRHHTPEALRAGAFLIQDRNLPSFNQHHFSYSIYYGAQATFQLGDNYWSVYRQRLHEVLLRNQSGNGSWSARGYDATFGPAYCTAMAVLALTVEYRYLPIYQRGEEPPDKDR
jgi:squalene cyclase